MSLCVCTTTETIFHFIICVDIKCGPLENTEFAEAHSVLPVVYYLNNMYNCYMQIYHSISYLNIIYVIVRCIAIAASLPSAWVVHDASETNERTDGSAC